MENVVYLLGAGFSAPLGLPVMSNFLEKAKDIYFAQPDKFNHFIKVFDTIKSMAVCKNYYTTDLFNIEEILSILEMDEQLGDEKSSSSFIKFIIDVVSFYTPPIESPRQRPGAWHNNLVGTTGKWNIYGSFVGSLFNLEFYDEQISNHGNPITKVYCKKRTNNIYQYSIVTLNYDLVLESICDFINNNYETNSKIKFTNVLNTNNISEFPALAKLHGSIDTGTIIPPTWNKGLNQAEIVLAWKLAYKLLMQANHIRIIGYSLPETDSYIKYLLRAAVVYAPHLKTIDVLCIDDTHGTIKKRYDEFILFKKYRFLSANVFDYLRDIVTSSKKSRVEALQPRQVIFDTPEMAHNNFFEKPPS